SPTAWSTPLMNVTVGVGSFGMIRLTEFGVTVRLVTVTVVMPGAASCTEVVPLRSLVTLEMVRGVALSGLLVGLNDKEQLGAAGACPPAASSAAKPTAKTPAMRKKRDPNFMPRTPVLCPDGFVDGRDVHAPVRAMFDRSASRGSRGVARQPPCGERCQWE